MATLEVKDTAGKKVASAEVADSIFAIEPNPFAVHQVVRSQMAARRQGTQSTKGRSDVSGGGAKPWRQKGTGRARQGSIRAGQWKGGGVIFGPTPRSYAFKVPNKVVKLAMRSVLSAKNADGELYVIDSFGLDAPSTRQAAAVLAALGIDRRVTVVVDNDDWDAIKSLRNLPRVRVITASEANTYDLVDNVSLLFTRPALEWLEGVLS
ncbi:MAG: 50S ribosomal protein L4 [Coriobacteriia bacterium]|nr:50S ribosomal protein L4 [Coriobacteriia bacterium]